MKLPMNVPTAPLVFTLPNTVEDIKKKSLTGKIETNIYLKKIGWCDANSEILKLFCIYHKMIIKIGTSYVLCDLNRKTIKIFSIHIPIKLL